MKDTVEIVVPIEAESKIIAMEFQTQLINEEVQQMKCSICSPLMIFQDQCLMSCPLLVPS